MRDMTDMMKEAAHVAWKPEIKIHKLFEMPVISLTPSLSLFHIFTHFFSIFFLHVFNSFLFFYMFISCKKRSFILRLLHLLSFRNCFGRITLRLLTFILDAFSSKRRLPDIKQTVRLITLRDPTAQN